MSLPPDSLPPTDRPQKNLPSENLARPRLKSPRTGTARLTSSMIALLAFTCAAGLGWLGALWAVTAIEARSTEAISGALTAAGATWATVQADGLQLNLRGTAPTEAERFRALSIAGSLVDAARVLDGITVAPARDIKAPRFSVEILRNDDGISLIGLIPATAERDAIRSAVADLAAGATVTDMLETAEHAVPPGWDKAVSFGIASLKSLPRSKISISADRVSITAITGSAAEKRKTEADLAQAKPEGVTLILDISAPRPVITPFTLRFLLDDQGARFDACSADTVQARDTILQAAAAAGLTEAADCVIGLGVPSPNWAAGVATAIAGLAEMGGGALTFSDADVSLIAGPKVTQTAFDRAVGDLEAKLPDVFSLSAVLPKKGSDAQAAAGPAEFVATLAEDGRVELRGRLPDERVRDAVDAYARARFGTDSVYAAARLDEGLPEGWPVRVLTALETLAELDHGEIRVQPATLSVQGVTGNPGASATIARLLSEKLGTGQDFKIIVKYDKALDPNAGLPTPKECAASISALLGQTKIAFAPGSAEINPASNGTLDAIARILRRCGAIPMEIGGHTDAQGRDQMNLALSQSRAEAVRAALLTRGVLTVSMTAQGYGETLPIADNKTETGREVNRRIEFKLLLTDAEAGKIAAATVAADAATPAPAPATNPASDPATGGVTAPQTAANSATTPATPTDPSITVLPAAEQQTRPKARPQTLQPTLPEQSAPENTLPEQSAPSQP